MTIHIPGPLRTLLGSAAPVVTKSNALFVEAMTVAEVLAAVERGDISAYDALAAELDGKNRAGIVNALSES